MPSRGSPTLRLAILWLWILAPRSGTCFTARIIPIGTINDSRRQFPFSHTDVLQNSQSNEVESSAPQLPPLVVLLPAYNEVERIGGTLETYATYLVANDQWKDESQFLVVDDGSDDGTADFCRNLQCSIPLDCVSLAQNEGKGAAVSFGICHLAKLFKDEPCLLLVADADGSGDMTSLDTMVQSLQTLIAQQQPEQDFWKTPAVVVGNRGYRGSSLSRAILRWGFRTTVRIICGDLRVSDSQCGFKLMTLAAAKQLYDDLNLQRWSHDVEVLYRAREYNMPIVEVTVPWQDKEGSKLVTSAASGVQASIVMLLEVLRMRIQYALGRWKLPLSDEEGTKQLSQ